jgi:hypothetical protein
MNRYWRGTTKNGDFVTEEQGSIWDSQKMKSLELITENTVIKLPDNMEYVQAKTASADLGSGKVSIESRYIGFYHNNSKIIVRIDEKTGNISIEAESIDT